ncbi:MAG: hypothetical protein JO326_03810 [Acetobacteraceae bacterium]|nr:hypothetical protein [Acetobacteraceae bacterium]
MAAAHAERRREGRKLRRRVAALCGQVLGFADAGAEQGITGADWPALAAEARTLAALRGDSLSPNIRAARRKVAASLWGKNLSETPTRDTSCVSYGLSSGFRDASAGESRAN